MARGPRRRNKLEDKINNTTVTQYDQADIDAFLAAANTIGEESTKPATPVATTIRGMDAYKNPQGTAGHVAVDATSPIAPTLGWAVQDQLSQLSSLYQNRLDSIKKRVRQPGREQLI